MNNQERVLSQESADTQEFSLRRERLVTAFLEEVDCGDVVMIKGGEPFENDKSEGVFSIAKKGAYYIGAAIEDDPNSEGKACGIVGVHYSQNELESFLTGGGYAHIDQNASPGIERGMEYMKSSFSLLLKLLDENPTIDNFETYTRENKRKKAYRVLERYGFKITQEDDGTMVLSLEIPKA